jgi:hypothetical protein
MRNLRIAGVPGEIRNENLPNTARPTCSVCRLSVGRKKARMRYKNKEKRRKDRERKIQTENKIKEEATKSKGSKNK